MTPVPTRFPHYILAGGESRRFGSDKARHLVAGQEMLSRVATTFEPFSASTTIVARSAGAYDDLGYSTIADAVSNAGPLAGLMTALLHAEDVQDDKTPCWVLLSSCDLIHGSADLIPPLIDLATEDRMAAVYLNSSRFEPFPGLYHTSLLPHLRQAIDTNQLSFQRLFRTLGPQIVSLDLPEAYGDLDMDHRPTDPSLPPSAE